MMVLSEQEEQISERCGLPGYGDSIPRSGSERIAIIQYLFMLFYYSFLVLVELTLTRRTFNTLYFRYFRTNNISRSKMLFLNLKILFYKIIALLVV